MNTITCTYYFLHFSQFNTRPACTVATTGRVIRNDFLSASAASSLAHRTKEPLATTSLRFDFRPRLDPERPIATHRCTSHMFASPADSLSHQGPSTFQQHRPTLNPSPWLAGLPSPDAA
ncbi:uncharacterized protein FOMMEDRAFT_17122 [Fomitiporia mediterranea MF3/22]|uniref:uncharacterized protein n=1 Tax=Fomitiporia mediterranea (strain MF3/22) TaxID=694068 RepID=UPI00044075EB|nr:uncharacterized protein FOMMEDRAFT_17122 [Fomitiporia mediterranea MF3/22]EJD06632.1 hypothetical protein FOMMEDRAFT_17122 [Fomitiporia mediterranea MF3/22]